MIIETVKVLQSIKAGHGDKALIYLEGEVFTRPNIPDVVLNEARQGTGTVSILNETAPSLPSVQHLDFYSEPQMKTPDVSTASTIKMRQRLERPKKTLIKRKKKTLIKRIKK